MRKLLFILIGFSIISCREKEVVKKELSEKQTKTELKTEKETAFEKSIPEQYIENDSLLSKMENDLDKIASDPQFTIDKKPVKNRHLDNVIDTIVTHSFGKSKLEFYKTQNEKWIYGARIENSNFYFLDSINVGKSKKALEEQIATELKSDVIKIGNLEQTSVFVFKIENGKILEIIYEGYVD